MPLIVCRKSTRTLTSILQLIYTLLILILCLPACSTLSYSPSPNYSRLNLSDFRGNTSLDSLNASSVQASNTYNKSNISLISYIPERSDHVRRLNSLSIDYNFHALSLAASPDSSQSSDNIGGSQYMWIVQGNSTGKLLPNCSDLCVIAEPGNFSVVLQPCEGMASSEQWLYDPQNFSITSRIGVSNNVRLCVEVIDPQNLQLRSCNASNNSQKWVYDNETMQFRGGLANNDGFPMYLMGQIRHPSSWGSGNNNFSLQLAAENSLDGNEFTSTFTLIPWINPLSIEPMPNSGSEGGNLVRNGGFEECNSDPAKGFILIGNTQPLYLCSWYVEINEVEYSGTNLWQPEEGTHSVHLNSANDAMPASLIQRIATRAGTNYTLGFYMAGNPDLNCGDTNKTMEVGVLPSSLQKQELWFDVSEAGDGYMHVFPLGFTATADYVNLTFTSLTPGSCGPLIDNITMQEINGPLPPLINPHATFTGNSRSRIPAYAKALLALAVVALVVTVVSLLIMKVKKRKLVNKRVDSVRNNRNAENARWWQSFKLEEAMGSFSETASGVQELTWKQIERATKNFTTILGEGGFSTVYRAELSDGRVGAVKMEKTRDRSRQIFKQELSVLVRLRHPNLVNLIGFCNEREEGILVFEYMAHGSLHQRLHPSAHQMYVPLIWKKRMEIALQIAYALQYLHDVAKPAVVHGDIKSANVLLDDNDNAKLCDFGFSSKAGPNSSVFHTTVASVKGSLGYLDPQYLKNGRLSSKSDIYSFGVLLIELVTGLHAFDVHRAEALTSFVASYVQDMDMMELIVDARLSGNFDKDELTNMCNVAKLCIQDDGIYRPTMAEVVFQLSSASTKLQSSTSDHPQNSNDVISSSCSDNAELYLYNSFDSDDIVHTKHPNSGHILL